MDSVPLLLKPLESYVASSAGLGGSGSAQSFPRPGALHRALRFHDSCRARVWHKWVFVSQERKGKHHLTSDLVISMVFPHLSSS